MPKIPLVNDVRYHGNEARMGLTAAFTGTLEVGDAVELVAAGTVARGTGPIIGFAASKEFDGMCAYNSWRVVQAKCAANLPVGRQLLVGDGNGGVAVGAGGTPCVVLNVYADGAQNYCSVYIM